ncbi:NAD-dependent epimerase/dehydratase family protein [Synechococcus elongatus]|uniref:NAD-dependent epimerase/dehydratase family protein n=1 Tax=Synechococcus elongatus PCC 11802 TaxID=2283154 RepID=A0AAT9K328_SYNEL|nr:NAD-dependent epimerase/dehydratase family protein [Synechococcus elongatus]QFZ91303.1 NAD-dependent epimerase/dehydratase family protein [Synechococcus elongatus PCC 11802]
MIHLIGSEGFIGQAIKREASDIKVQSWSHQTRRDNKHFFDILDQSSWSNLIDSQPKTAILLSWPGLPNYQQSFHIVRNLPASIQLIEKLISNGLQRLVVAGTCYEYGLQNGQLREDQLTDPVNLYAIAKDTLRRTVSTLCDRAGVQWCWLRIFYPYGQGQNPNSLLPSLERAVMQGEPSFPMSSGRQIRDFIPVEETARQLLLLATHPQAKGIYNGGSGKARSLREIVEARLTELGGSLSLQRGTYADREDEPLAFWADMSRLNILNRNHLSF